MPPGAIAPPQSAAAHPSPAVPESYFTESRKGEVNELRILLRNFGTERDPLRKREIIKKVIAYMTLGIDVSSAFYGHDVGDRNSRSRHQEDGLPLLV
jgi:hypothetical protein